MSPLRWREPISDLPFAVALRGLPWLPSMAYQEAYQVIYHY